MRRAGGLPRANQKASTQVSGSVGAQAVAGPRLMPTWVALVARKKRWPWAWVVDEHWHACVPVKGLQRALPVG